MPDLTDAEIKTLRGLLEKATPGEWEVHEIESSEMYCDDCDKIVSRGIRTPEGGLNKGVEYELFDKADAELIAAARNHLPALIAEVERLRRIEDHMCEFGEEDSNGNLTIPSSVWLGFDQGKE
jgi:hypothetical protein